MAPIELKKDVSVVLAGAAGQGIQTVEHVLTRVLKLSGYYTFSFTEFMSRIRGGINSTEIRVASEPVNAFVNRIDILCVFHAKAIPHLKDRLSKDTIVIGAEENIKDAESDNTFDVPFIDIASDVGNRVYANTVAVGLLASLLGVEQENVSSHLETYFGDRSEDIVEANLEAGKRGYEIGTDILESGDLGIDIARSDEVTDDLLLGGSEAVGLGAIAGGCNFICSYPMSPSTGVLVYLAKYGQAFDIVVEQAEDEISALNMGLGAASAGGRAIVTTSGGGFALMNETLSLAGVAELPAVIHLAQRPGPGTGMPTRTEQGDLLFALFGGHGEFPRAILAPGTAADAFYLTQHAFNLAAKYQVPVIVMTDQYLIDSVHSLRDLPTDDLEIERHIVETNADYKRYAITESGVSPRGIPGYGQGLVVNDSHVHDEAGHMTENFDMRVKMNEKRLRKLEGLKEDAIAPELTGAEEYKHLVIGWGTTYHGLQEALQELDRDDVALLYCKQVYPLHSKVAEHIKQAERTIVVENNATGQFAKLIKMETGLEVDDHIRKYNGLPFAVEELVAALEEKLA
jgi:2-oxoglutarate ferredoxin oxidoreductase subunit alpha